MKRIMKKCLKKNPKSQIQTIPLTHGPTQIWECVWHGRLAKGLLTCTIMSMYIKEKVTDLVPLASFSPKTFFSV